MSVETASQFAPVGSQVVDIDLLNHESKVVDEIVSLCMNCEENGLTKLLLTKIPFFRDVIIMSFYCEKCHFKNNEIQAAGEIQPQGVKYSFRVTSVEDLQRQIVKSDSALFKIEEATIEIPPGRGRLSNVEGFVATAADDLEIDQDRRKDEHPELYEKLVEIIAKLRKMATGELLPFTITIEDVSGNSTVEPKPTDGVGKYYRKEFPRNAEQNAQLGLTSTGEDPGFKDPTVTDLAGLEGLEDSDILEGKMYTLPCDCPGCGKPAAMNLQMVKIPYFKQVVISAVVCIHCGYKTNEVKTGGEIPEKGRRTTLKVKNAQDLRRDILKAETAMLSIPEINVQVEPGTMGGRFTTVEGLLTQIRDDLRSSIFEIDGGTGDSMEPQKKSAWDTFFGELEKAIQAEMEYTIVLEDPLAGSYIQNYMAPEVDPQLSEEDYERTQEEEEDLGLSDMRTHQNEDGEYVREGADVKDNPNVKDDPSVNDTTDVNDTLNLKDKLNIEDTPDTKEAADVKETSGT